MKERKAFESHHNRTFQMMFPNGLVVSMNVGSCGYNDNHDSIKFEDPTVKTNTVEIAVWDNNNPDDGWITKEFFPHAEDGETSIAGYVTMKEFSDAIIKIIQR